MRILFRAAVAVAVTVTALAFPTGSASGDPAATVPADGLDRVLVSGPGYTPPPAPASSGVQAQSGWYGPYTYRNARASKCMDILNASQASLAPAVHYTCLAGRSSQLWWDYIVEQDGFGYSRLLGNNYTKKCLHVDGKNIAVKQVGCAILVNQLFDTTTANLQSLQNIYGCLEIAGGDPNNNARLVTWDCHGRSHQVWYKYNA